MRAARNALGALAAGTALCASQFAVTLADAAPAGDNTIRAVIPARLIAVESNSPEVARLARKAFGAHGEYRLVAGSAARTVRLTKTGPGSVNLAFATSGASHTRTVTAGTWQEAVLRACDEALRLDGLRPLFAGKIAFVSDRTGKSEIYASDLFLDAVLPLTSYRSMCTTPRWATGGSEVLHTTYKNGNFTDVYAAAAVPDAAGKLKPPRPVLVNKRGTTVGAVANPRDGRLAFANSSAGDMDIYTADAGGRGIRRFVAGGKGEVETDPAWSADGTRLAFTGGANGRPRLYTVGAGGGKPVPVTTGVGNCVEPTWNPVFQSRLAFAYAEKGGYKIGVVDTAGSAPFTPVATAGSDRGTRYVNPVWCADGRHIIATRETGFSKRLVLIDTDPRRTPAKETVLSGTSMSNCSEPDYIYTGITK